MTADYSARRAPVQADYDHRRYRAPGSISWAEHIEAYEAYAKRYGQSPSANRIVVRGGFSYDELTDLLGHEPTTWRAIGSKEAP